MLLISDDGGGGLPYIKLWQQFLKTITFRWKGSDSTFRCSSTSLLTVHRPMFEDVCIGKTTHSFISRQGGDNTNNALYYIYIYDILLACTIVDKITILLYRVE